MQPTSKTALVVDDSASLRAMVSHTLRSAGFSVIEGTDGNDALARSHGQKLDVVITDLNMPGMDGLGLIRALRAQLATKHTPILLLTTESRADGKQQARAAGATGWIVKPFNPEGLLGAVARVVTI